jgi:hypothetical protein
MIRSARAIFFCVALTFSLPAGRVHADTITVTGGNLQIQGGLLGAGTALLESDRLTASLTLTPFGFYQPGLTCFPCTPGGTLGVDGQWVSPDVFGGVMLDGSFYIAHGIASPDSLTIQILGDDLLLPVWTGDSVILQHAFTFTGLFLYQPADGPFSSVALVGAGTANITLRPLDFAEGWVFDHAEYQFTPVPEPSTLTLLAVGILGLVRRRARARPET